MTLQIYQFFDCLSGLINSFHAQSSRLCHFDKNRAGWQRINDKQWYQLNRMSLGIKRCHQTEASTQKCEVQVIKTVDVW